MSCTAYTIARCVGTPMTSMEDSKAALALAHKHLVGAVLCFVDERTAGSNVQELLMNL